MDNLFLFYQPIVDISNNSIFGIEILLRHKDRNNNFITPFVAHPNLSFSDSVALIDEWVISKAIKYINLTINIFVNIAVGSLSSENIISLLKKYSRFFNKNSFYLELPESADFTKLITWVSHFKNSNIKFAMDDFGRKSSSLQIMKDKIVDIIKLDKWWADSIETEDLYVIKTLEFFLGIFEELGLTVIAEGVETIKQVNFYKNHNINLLQGFYFYMPEELKLSKLKDLKIS